MFKLCPIFPISLYLVATGLFSSCFDLFLGFLIAPATAKQKKKKKIGDS
jgi:hypothetical protein